MSGRTVLVMAKAPRSGSVKTRLAPMLGHARCAALQAVLLGQAVATAEACRAAHTVVAVDPPEVIAEIAAELPPTCELLTQSDGDLGERMAAASSGVLAATAGPLVVIGTDLPLLRTSHLEDAFGALETGCDVVFGPALDGGYYLVGLRGEHREVFDIAPASWGGPDVLSASLAAAGTARLRVGLLEVQRDLDTARDAIALLSSPELPAAIREALTTMPTR
ncbi:MAG: TIGR04282 family arsenosugar biosynthesis glycosyltransferase [Solirubrobacteraceae bacterium]